MANIGVKLGDHTTCVRLGTEKVKKLYLGSAEIYTGSLMEPCIGLCQENNPGIPSTFKDEIKCCGDCGEKCAGLTPERTWIVPVCDYECPGCCCNSAEGDAPYSPGTLANVLTQSQCDRCCVSLFNCSGMALLSSCADCPPGASCYEFSPGVAECMANFTVSDCSDCPQGLSCQPATINGGCSTWQPDCQINRIIGACYATPKVVRVTAVGTLPSPPGYPANEPFTWGPTNMYWAGYNKFTNGGNNGWVGLYPNCEGKWSIYAYGNVGYSGWFSAVRSLERTGGIDADGKPRMTQRLSTYKTSANICDDEGCNNVCDPEGYGIAQAYYYTWGGPWGIGDVVYLPFDLAVTVEAVESFSMPPENPVAVNPFP